MSQLTPDQEKLYRKIKVMANKQRFKILCLTEKEPMSIVELSKEIKLAYNKTADYVASLENEELVRKTKSGRTIEVNSLVQPQVLRQLFKG